MDSNLECTAKPISSDGNVSRRETGLVFGQGPTAPKAAEPDAPFPPLPGRYQKQLLRGASVGSLRPNRDRENYGRRTRSTSLGMNGFRDLQLDVREYRGESKNEQLDGTHQRPNPVDEETLLNLTKQDKAASREATVTEMAQYRSIRQTAVVSVALMLVLQTVTATSLVRAGDVSIDEAILFTMYSVTTAGFGSVDIPFTPGFLLYLVVYMLVGIGLTTVLASQVYLYVALVTRISKSSVDQRELADRGLNNWTQAKAQCSNEENPEDENDAPAAVPHVEALKDDRRHGHLNIGQVSLSLVDRLKLFFRSSEATRCFCLTCYLVGLLLIGVIGMMSLEGWTFVEALYFSTFVMTTVGFGDYFPTKSSSIWFVIFWLPFNISFLSIFMGNLGRYYMMLSSWNVIRKEKQLRKIYGFTTPLLGEEGPSRQIADEKYQIQRHGMSATELDCIQTMGDVVRFVLGTLAADVSLLDDKSNPVSSIGALSETFMLQSSLSHPGTFEKNGVRKPSFALMVLVQERFAHIIANDIAGFHSDLCVKDTTVSMTVESIQEVANQWQVPAGALTAFRAVAFEALIFVGEKKLVSKGAEALLNLSPFEFHEIFSPLLAALADSGTMEGWLAVTTPTAAEKFPRSYV